ncbi:MAG TPA: hypothetical protein DEQ14_02420 [Treponema sp.]|nr:hypothetical protein [Treponema sp.]
MTEKEIEKWVAQDEKIFLILGIVVGALGLFGMLGFIPYAVLVAWPIAGYNIWKYLKIKEAKKMKEERNTKSN